MMGPIKVRRKVEDFSAIQITEEFAHAIIVEGKRFRMLGIDPWHWYSHEDEDGDSCVSGKDMSKAFVEIKTKNGKLERARIGYWVVDEGCYEYQVYSNREFREKFERIKDNNKSKDNGTTKKEPIGWPLPEPTLMTITDENSGQTWVISVKGDRP
jgi:hypothetical protein